MFLYVLALFLLGCGSHMSHKILSGPLVDRPMNPVVLFAISVIATVAWLAWFLHGFWIAWWLPLVGLVAGGIATGLIDGYYRTRYPQSAIGISAVSSLLGFGAMIGAL